MNNQIKTYGILGFMVMLLGFATCEGIKCNQKKKDAHDAKEVVLTDNVKATEKVFDEENPKYQSLLKKDRVKDSLLNIQSVTIAQLNYRLSKRENTNTSNVASMLLEQVNDSIDKLQDKHSRELYADFLNAKLKDSVHINDSIIIANQRTEIVQDSILNTECNITLNDCQNANKAKESLIEFEKPKHPAWLKFKTTMSSPYVWVVTAVAGLETWYIYLKNK